MWLASVTLLLVLALFSNLHGEQQEGVHNKPRRPLPWFISVELKKPDYVAYAAVAIVSARERTAGLLEPHVLVSTTEESSFVDWCIEQGVVVHRYTPVLAEDINALIKTMVRTEEFGRKALGGVFGRIDAPRVYRQWGGTSEYLLYTDCDILWDHLSVEEISQITSFPEQSLVAIGPQESKNSMKNSGVLMFHVDRWLEEFPNFVAYCRTQNWSGQSWDQGLILHYFVRNKNLSTLLPNSWNWKVYWGRPSAGESPAILYHFHGPKPLRCLDINNSSGVPSLAECPIDGYKGLLHHPDFLNLAVDVLGKFKAYYDEATTCTPHRVPFKSLAGKKFISDAFVPCGNVTGNSNPLLFIVKSRQLERERLLKEKQKMIDLAGNG